MTARGRAVAFATILVGLVGVARSFGGERGATEFQIGRNGRCILLPLTLNDREILGLLDTGASASAFDASLAPLLGNSRGAKRIQTPAGESSVETYDWPDVRMGSEQLRSDKPVVCIDLDQARKASGAELFAIIGMDVLRTLRLQIDFDAGILRLLDGLPESRAELGERIRIDFAENGTPRLPCSVHERQDIPFLIDTGTFGNSIESSLFDRLAEEQRIRPGKASMTVTVGGAVIAEAGWLDRLSIGPFQHRNLRVARINVNSVGLRYLSRYRVTFDFPANSVYLQKGKQFLRPEPTATSGLSLAWMEGEIVVMAVLKDGPAARAGVQPNDVLTRVDGKGAGEFDHLALRSLLTSEIGRSVPLTIRRRMRDVDVMIVLDEK